ncbi:hypothetical protein [Pseudomonas rustica]|nr:hypothetical protein [Pseudomonas rustica]
MNTHFNDAIEADDGGFVVCRGCKAEGSFAEPPRGECPTPYKPASVLLEESLAREQALQMRLNAADQRIDELEALLLRSNELFYAIQGDPGAVPSSSIDAMRGEVFTALKPAAGSVYKPGLYAVRHIDNWDGERDVALTFAMLDADGKWTEKETGEPLLAYKGDKVLRAWPLDCSHAPGTQIIGVPRDWLQDWALELVEAAQDGGQMSNQVEHLLEIHSKP